MAERPAEVAPAQAVDRSNGLRSRGRDTAAAIGRVIVQPDREAGNESRQDEERNDGSESPVALGDLT